MRSPGRLQPQQSQVCHCGDGPGHEIGPQHAPGPSRPNQSADRSTATVGGHWPKFLNGLERNESMNVLRIANGKNRRLDDNVEKVENIDKTIDRGAA